MELEPSRAARAVEAVCVAVAGALLGAASTWVLVSWLASWSAWWPGVVGAAVGGLNGAIGGWRRVYAWREPRGWIAFVLDSTWALVPVVLALVAHLVAGARDGGYEPSLTLRQNRHVYRRGMALKPGFAFTIGNVISGAGDVDKPRRRRLVTDHEDVHVWQSRWFGPLYPAIYVSWAALGAAIGSLVWLVRRRDEPIGRVVESCAYYVNPFEWWAYSRDDLWPPPGKVTGIGWRKAAARPLAQVRATRRPR